MRCHPVLRGALALSVLVAPATAPFAGAEDGITTLAGTVRDPVTDEVLPGAKVRLGSGRAVSGPDGSFRIDVEGAGGRFLRTTFRSPQKRPYKSWTPTGGQYSSRFYLFPKHSFELPGTDVIVDPEEFAQHFSDVYRSEMRSDPRFRGRLIRWVEQPRIFIADRLIRRTESDWIALSQRIPAAQLERATSLLRSTMAP